MNWKKTSETVKNVTIVEKLQKSSNLISKNRLEFEMSSDEAPAVSGNCRLFPGCFKIFSENNKNNPDVIYLTLILVNSSKSHEFTISQKVEKFIKLLLKCELQSSVTEITRHVFENWPEEWNDHKVERADILRLVFQVFLKSMKRTKKTKKI